MSRYRKDIRGSVKNGGLFRARQIWSYYCHNRPQKSEYRLVEKDYESIVTAVNEAIVDALLDGKSIKLPYRAGILLITKGEVAPYINKKGKLVCKSKVDWNTTKKLWEEDEEAKDDHIFVRFDTKERYYVRFNKLFSGFPNGYYVDFRPGKTFKIRIGKSVKNGALKDVPIDKYIWRRLFR